MKKGLIFMTICALFGSAETQATSWIENAVAGKYFHNVSVGESGAASSETWDMIKSKFSTNHDFEYNEIEVNDFIFPYYVKKSEGDVLDFLLQGIMEKDSGWAFDHSFDDTKNIRRTDTLMRETSLEFFSKIAKIYENKTLLCHMSTKISACREEEKGVGNIYGHANYARVTIKNGNMDLFLCEPCQLEQSGQHYAAYQMRFSWNNNPVNVTHTHRGDQRLNSTDCALFSFIYLMYAIEGRDVSKLSNVDIYNGFTRWIEGEKNFLSLKKMSKQKEAELLNVLTNAGKNFIVVFDPSFIDYSNELLTHANAMKSDFLNKNKIGLFDDISLCLEKKKSNKTVLTLYKKTEELNKEIMENLLACIKQKNEEILLYKGIASKQQLIELRNNMPAISNIYGSTFTKMRRTIIDITLSAIRQTNAFVTSLASIFYLKIS